MVKVNVNKVFYDEINRMKSYSNLSGIINNRNQLKLLIDHNNDDELIMLICKTFYDEVNIIRDIIYTVPIPVGLGKYKTLVMTCNGVLTLSDHTYHSLKKLKEHNIHVPGGLTEKRIKESELSWSWQFAEVIENE